jgi:ABC-2 type transport system permease protein
MNRTYAIFKKEIKHYFYSPMAYIMLTVFLFVSSWFFTGMLDTYISLSINSLNPYGQSYTLSLDRDFFGPFIINMAIIFLFFMPFLTMRIISEERKMGTFELLATSPIKNIHIIAGKYLAVIFLYIIMLLFTAVYFLGVYFVNPFNIQVLLVCYLGVFLLGSAFLAIGFLCSSLFKQPLFAAVTTFGALLVLWISGWGVLGDFGKEISIITHIESFTKGIISLKDVFYFVSVIFFSLFCANLYIDSIRWRE